jgi:hypothetical protein
MRKIIYLIEQPLDERNFDRFGIQHWIDRAWTVEIWDFTPLAHPAVWRDFLASERPLSEFAGYFPIASKSELKTRLRVLGPVDHFVDFTGEGYVTLSVKAALVWKGARRVICAPGSIPAPGDALHPGVLARLRALSAKGAPFAARALAMALARRLLARAIRPALAVVSGENSIAAAGPVEEILKVHSFDYDIYLKVARHPGGVRGPRYAVFIDQDLCFHPDFLYQGTPFVVTPEKYFPAVCRCLRGISEDLDLQLRIAAHPRARYFQRLADPFEGIPIVYGKTAELIRDCDLVVCHDSTAIHFAVLFNKPILFVTSDELLPTYEGRSINQAAAALGKSAVNLDRHLAGVDWRRESEVDAARYRDYKNKYIKVDGSPERPMWETIIDHIERAETTESIRVRAHCAPTGGAG